jgi:hypothetical protein
MTARARLGALNAILHRCYVPASMRMRQTLADFEATFYEELEEERERAERIRLEAQRRTRRRHAVRSHKHGSMRFALLVTVLIATAVIVTIAMFQTLYYVMG